MVQKVRIKILKLEYGGDSVGNDIRLDVEISGQPFSLNQTIKPKTISELNQEIAQLPIGGEVLEAPIHIKVTEKDLIFSDAGEIDGIIRIDPLKTEPQTFDFQIKVREKNKIIGKSIAIFLINLTAEIFNPDNIQLKQYNSRDPGKDYNRFDDDIKAAVKFWNDEFLNQEYPPSIPLDPDLVKAMIYIESEIGYYKPLKKGAYPSYPDIIQVGNPGDPALHTLNNDGWVSPKTGKVAREYEWTTGGERVLDYKGEANAKTHQESLKWGVRWLYHKAQEIKDGKRSWRNWKEAVKGYGPRGYEKNVWNVYTKGVDPRGIKLWSLAFFLPILPVLFFSSWLIFNQGKISISFKDIPNTGDYQVFAKIVDGPWFENILVANVYDNGTNSFGLDKKFPIYTRYIDIDNDGQKEIEIIGTYYGPGTIKYLLKKEDGQYKIVHHVDEWGTEKEAFSSEQISFLDINNNGELDVATDSFLPYKNAPDQVWTF